ALSQFLHWLIVTLIIVQVILAQYAENLPISPKKVKVYGWHKAVGLTVLALAVLRLLWRWANPTPALPATLKPYERVLAGLTHTGLYVLLFAPPVPGWVLHLGTRLPGELVRALSAAGFRFEERCALQRHEVDSRCLGAGTVCHSVFARRG